MDLVVLSGGRGRRLGALTSQKQKGTLRFEGVPILLRTLDQWLRVNALSTLWVVGGYRRDDVIANPLDFTSQVPK